MTAPTIRVLHIFVADYVGGCEILTQSLIENFPSQYSISVACPPGNLADRLSAAGIDVRRHQYLARLYRRGGNSGFAKALFDFLLMTIKATFGILGMVSKEKFQVIQVNNANAGPRILAAAFLAQTLFRPFLSKTKWLLVNHNAKYFFRSDGIFDPLCVLCFKMVAVSNAVRENYHPWLRNSIIVLYNGIETGRFRFSPESRESARIGLGLDTSETALAIIGRVSETKGQHHGIEALGLIKSRRSEARVRLFLIGMVLEEDEPYQDSLKRLCIEKGIVESVQFLGQRNDVADILSGLDIIINASPSRVSEALPLTLTEAMSCERIVVAPRIGGIPEIITDGYDGFLFEPDSSESLASTLEGILDLEKGLGRIGLMARKKAEEKFSRSRMVQEYSRLYDV